MPATWLVRAHSLRVTRCNAIAVEPIVNGSATRRPVRVRAAPHHHECTRKALKVLAAARATHASKVASLESRGNAVRVTRRYVNGDVVCARRRGVSRDETLDLVGELVEWHAFGTMTCATPMTRTVRRGACTNFGGFRCALASDSASINSLRTRILDGHRTGLRSTHAYAAAKLGSRRGACAQRLRTARARRTLRSWCWRRRRVSELVVEIVDGKNGVWWHNTHGARWSTTLVGSLDSTTTPNAL